MVVAGISIKRTQADARAKVPFFMFELMWGSI